MNKIKNNEWEFVPYSSIKNEALNDYKMAHGGKLKQYAPGGDVWDAQTFNTPEGINTPTNVSLNKNPLTNWEAYRQLWETEARKAGQLKPNERFKFTKEMQEFMYDWALDNNPQLIRDMYKTYGATNKDEAKFKNKDFNNLSLQDLKDLRDNFIDNYRGKRVFAPELGIKTTIAAPKGTDPTQIQFKDKIVKEYLQPINEINPNVNIPFALPNNYERLPLNYYKINPEFIDPRYLDIQSQLNEITRGQRAFTNTLGDRSAANTANLLQAQANTYNANNQVFGTKYNYDREQDANAQQFNAQAKMDTNQYNQQAWFNQLENPIREREGILDTQKRTDEQAAIGNANKQQQFYNNLNYIQKTFPYYQKNMSPVDAIAFAYLMDEQPKAKNGKIIRNKKLKIKPKIKK